MSTYTPAEQAQHLRDLCTALRSGEFKQGREALRPIPKVEAQSDAETD